jgi:hypothetical protein
MAKRRATESGEAGSAGERKTAGERESWRESAGAGSAGERERAGDDLPEREAPDDMVRPSTMAEPHMIVTHIHEFDLLWYDFTKLVYNFGIIAPLVSMVCHNYFSLLMV